MKILFMAPYITVDGNEKFSKHKTGLGHMIFDIIDSISNNKNDCYLVTQTYFSKESRINNFILESKTIIDILIHLKLKYAKYLFEILPNLTNLSDKIRCILYFICGGHFEEIIKKRKPDVISIHGLDVSTIPFIIASIETGSPFTITLHGINSASDYTVISNYQKFLEQEFIQSFNEKNVKVSIISSGIKERLQAIFNNNLENMIVINNGVKNLKSNLDYNIDKNKDFKVFTIVGNISQRKNQEQILRAIKLLPTEKLSNVKFIFIGQDNSDGNFIHLIEKLQLEENVEYLGQVNRGKLNSIYQRANYNLTTSLDEGFGLPIIEAFQFGLPTLCFGDIDAIGDIYSEKTMLLIENHSDQAVADGILSMMDRDWDEDYIISYAENFTLEKMSEKYVEFFYSDITNSFISADIISILKKYKEKEAKNGKI